MAKQLKYTAEVQDSLTVEAWHVSQSIEALTGQDDYDITVSGSFTLTGSLYLDPNKLLSVQQGNVLGYNPTTGQVFYQTSSLNTGSFMITASAASNILEFTKGDGSTFNVTINTGSALSTSSFNTATGSFMTTASISNNIITFTKGDNTTFPIPITTASEFSEYISGSGTRVGNDLVFWAGNRGGEGSGSVFVIDDPNSQIIIGDFLDVNNGNFLLIDDNVQKITAFASGGLEIQIPGEAVGATLTSNLIQSLDKTFQFPNTGGIIPMSVNNHLADTVGQIYVSESIGFAVSDESSDLTTGANKITFRMPYAFQLNEVRGSVGTAPVGSTIEVNLNASGSTILSTILSIDDSEKTSTSATTPAVIEPTSSSLADDVEMTIDINQIGSSTAGAGLKVWLIGHKI